ncbi:MAG: hypothetical protein ACR2G2_04305 [Pseudonocardia sp.]
MPTPFQHIFVVDDSAGRCDLGTDVGSGMLRIGYRSAPGLWISDAVPRCKAKRGAGFRVRWAVTALAVVAVAACSAGTPIPRSPSAPLSSAGTAAPGVPLTHPLPNPTPSGLGLTLTEFARIPRSTPNPPVESGDNLDRWARINYLGEIPDGSGRLFVPDLNGKLYVLRNGQPQVYLDVAKQVGPSFWDHDGIGTGFGFVAFHPDFARNGKFYTVDSEARDALTTKRPTLPPRRPSSTRG